MSTGLLDSIQPLSIEIRVPFQQLFSNNISNVFPSKTSSPWHDGAYMDKFIQYSKFRANLLLYFLHRLWYLCWISGVRDLFDFVCTNWVEAFFSSLNNAEKTTILYQKCELYIRIIIIIYAIHLAWKFLKFTSITSLIPNSTTNLQSQINWISNTRSNSITKHTCHWGLPSLIYF